MDVWNPGTVYLKHKETGKADYTTQHQCWNTTQFIANQMDACSAVNEERKKKKEKGKISVEVSNSLEYYNERFAHRRVHG